MHVIGFFTHNPVGVESVEICGTSKFFSDFPGDLRILRYSDSLFVSLATVYCRLVLGKRQRIFRLVFAAFRFAVVVCCIVQ
jgi:hypothetical protein